MKEVNPKQLTSNAFVNKLLLTNAQFNDWIVVDGEFPGPHYERFSTILEQALEENSITKDELVYLLDNHFHVLDHLLELREDDVLFLIHLEYRLESLVKHFSGEVHIELARKGVRLDIFWQHADPRVRAEVAKHGYNLKLLVQDGSCHVREEVAKLGYRLDLLINDPYWSVREQVSLHGYGLSYIVPSKNQSLRSTAERLLRRRDL